MHLKIKKFVIYRFTVYQIHKLIIPEMAIH